MLLPFKAKTSYLVSAASVLVDSGHIPPFRAVVGCAGRSGVEPLSAGVWGLLARWTRGGSSSFGLGFCVP